MHAERTANNRVIYALYKWYIMPIFQKKRMALKKDKKNSQNKL